MRRLFSAFLFLVAAAYAADFLALGGVQISGMQPSAKVVIFLICLFAGYRLWQPKGIETSYPSERHEGTFAVYRADMEQPAAVTPKIEPPFADDVTRDRLDPTERKVRDGAVFVRGAVNTTGLYRLAVIGLLVGAIAGGAWMFRYDTKAGAYTTSIVLDRWTGTVYRCGVYVDRDANTGCVRQN